MLVATKRSSSWMWASVAGLAGGQVLAGEGGEPVGNGAEQDGEDGRGQGDGEGDKTNNVSP
jgi:hypothetical protein